jgi:hypothetical protein
MSKTKIQPINIIDLNKKRSSYYEKYQRTPHLKLINKKFTIAVMTTAIALTIGHIYPQHKTYDISGSSINQVQLVDNNYEITLENNEVETISKGKLEAITKETANVKTPINLPNGTIVYVTSVANKLDILTKTTFESIGCISAIIAGETLGETIYTNINERKKIKKKGLFFK